MLQAYLGIVSQRGLEAFCPEHPQTEDFLWRRARRIEGGAVCFWSVIPDDAAAQINAALKVGWPRRALEYLDQTARDFGLLPPPENERTEAHECPLPASYRK